MSRRSKILFLSLFLLVFGAACLTLPKLVKHKSIGKNKEDHFFSLVPIEFYSSSKMPCVKAFYKEKPFYMGLDLGSSGNLISGEQFLSNFSDKILDSPVEVLNFHGNKYRSERYRVFKTKIGRVIFKELSLRKASEEEFLDTILLMSDAGVKAREPEVLTGWKTFYHSNFLLSCFHSLVGFFDSVDTLKGKGIPVHKFTKVPLLLDNGYLEFWANTEKGALRCMLDTGATFNIINRDIPEGLVIQEWLKRKVESRENYSSFEVQGKPLKAQGFCKLPLNFPCHIEAVLGMEFLQHHAIFIDFKNKELYIAPNSELGTWSIKD